MIPFAIRRGDYYSLFCAGADKSDRRRIWFATAAVYDLGVWKRYAMVLDLAGNAPPPSRGAAW